MMPHSFIATLPCYSLQNKHFSEELSVLIAANFSPFFLEFTWIRLSSPPVLKNCYCPDTANHNKAQRSVLSTHPVCSASNFWHNRSLPPPWNTFFSWLLETCWFPSVSLVNTSQTLFLTYHLPGLILLKYFRT